MKYTLNGIRNISRERADKVKPLYLELISVIADDSKQPAYRQRRERELRAQIASINDSYAKRIKEAAQEAAEEPRRKWAEGSGLKAEQLAEVPLVVRQYEGKTKLEQRQLVAEIAADLDAGATARALVKARAAITLDIPLGAVEARLADADPVRREAKHTRDAIEGLTELALNEPLREVAAAGLANVHERVYLKAFALDRKLREDVAFPDQVEAGYTGPDVERNGYPANPFPEPHDPARDEVRAKMERHAGPSFDPAADDARRAARDTPDGDGDGES